MAWIRLDDQIAHHPKFVKAGPLAAWLWVCGQSYSARYLTDGFIPADALATLGDVPHPDKQAARLVLAGLWEACDGGGWNIHDYHDYQPTRDVVEQRREMRREAGRIGGRRSGEHQRQQLAEQRAKQVALQGARDTDMSATKQTHNPVPVPVPGREIVPHGTLSLRRASIDRRNPRIQNEGDPMPLWDWQFSKFRDGLKPKFGDGAWQETMAWVDRVGDELTATGAPVNVSDPVKWWDARYAADWADGTVDDLAAFKALGRGTV